MFQCHGSCISQYELLQLKTPAGTQLITFVLTSATMVRACQCKTERSSSFFKEKIKFVSPDYIWWIQTVTSLHHVFEKMIVYDIILLSICLQNSLLSEFVQDFLLGYSCHIICCCNNLPCCVTINSATCNSAPQWRVKSYVMDPHCNQSLQSNGRANNKTRGLIMSSISHSILAKSGHQ